MIDYPAAAHVFKDRTQTLRGCVGDRQLVVNAIAEVLVGDTTFAVEEKVLRVSRGDHSLSFRAVEGLPGHD